MYGKICVKNANTRNVKAYDSVDQIPNITNVKYLMIGREEEKRNPYQQENSDLGLKNIIPGNKFMVKQTDKSKHI
jgi:hypothetical protein